MEEHDIVEGGVWVRRCAPPPGHGPVKGLAVWREGASPEVLEGGCVGVHIADAPPALDAHITDS